MNDPRISLVFDGSTARLTLKRPEKLNALDAAMIEGLFGAARAIEAHPDVRVAILAAEGKAFCAGGDIAAWGGLEPLAMWREWTRAGHRAFEALARLRVPLVAVLAGHAFGGGLELAATADIRIAEEGARFGLPETGLGMVPGWSGTQRLVRRFGAQAVRRLSLFGDMVEGPDALALGIVDEVVPRGEGAARADAIAKVIAARGPVAIQVAKQMINAAEGEDKDVALESIAGAMTSFSSDLKEGVAAFREKRPPKFEGR